MSLIREDCNGLYVKTNGAVYRPQASIWSYDHRVPGKSHYKAGDKVSARAISQSPHARVGDEVWALHGGYIVDVGGKAMTITDTWTLWYPAYARASTGLRPTGAS